MLTDEMREYFKKLGKKGGKARAKKLSKKQLSDIGKLGADARRLTATQK